ncbi:CHAD domain-containing protein [Aurantiacibacter poecillastricola]|uniref:CHAD domain-containing protein n=1 Tax=Aurantiacibacter poecillastricola TaxID=3064385 RepID=UPI00273D87A1|nr:CHAD domain-containing protein [Aurantiacibacter sp. 219JJ12-13]MDP5261566.1 CHAD domain-containing protein [Aurantiacibacter sp. 219JJ12-13]
MAYCIKPDDRSVAAAIRRVATEQAEKAVKSIDVDPYEDAVHDLRKRCKKIRGLVRFVRPAFPDYKATNAFFRDTARIVDAYRDARVMQDTYDALMDAYGEEVDRSALAGIRAEFTRQRTDLLNDGEVSDRLAECRRRMEEGLAMSRDWALEEDGFDAFEGGMAKTYKRARKAAGKAMDHGGGEAHHEMRKRVKYHWMHSRMLRPLWPGLFKARAKLAKDLSDVLGDHHDLTVFRDRLKGDEAEDARVMDALAAKRSETLSQEAAEMAEKLLAAKPGDLVDQVANLWSPWAKRHGFS